MSSSPGWLDELDICTKAVVSVRLLPPLVRNPRPRDVGSNIGQPNCKDIWIIRDPCAPAIAQAPRAMMGPTLSSPNYSAGVVPEVRAGRSRGVGRNGWRHRGSLEALGFLSLEKQDSPHLLWGVSMGCPTFKGYPARLSHPWRAGLSSCTGAPPGANAARACPGGPSGPATQPPTGRRPLRGGHGSSPRAA